MKKGKDSPNTKYQILNTFFSGQSLVEVMVAVAILALVVTALVLGTTVAVRNAAFSKDQARATKYAQQAMEWMRSERDKDWTSFVGKSGKTYCLNSSPPTWIEGGCGSSYVLGGMFKREAVLVGGDPKVEVRITVSWQGTSGKIHQSKLTSYFTKWQ